ncbi:hypothetical protein PIB30_081322 [Stylosanthes scabra]|uniref:Uncharacterized protein n=1 Tax=Stylosanthes scabra TaxID=79078 RepID=A0ABU6ZQH1_9FABA|nr:hypothetical protein [Stylosanthes scabra]
MKGKLSHHQTVNTTNKHKDGETINKAIEIPTNHLNTANLTTIIHHKTPKAQDTNLHIIGNHIHPLMPEILAELQDFQRQVHRIVSSNKKVTFLRLDDPRLGHVGNVAQTWPWAASLDPRLSLSEIGWITFGPRWKRGSNVTWGAWFLSLE